MMIALQLIYQQKRVTLQLPDNVPLYQIAPAVAQKLNLSQQNEDGTIYLYYFTYQDEMLPNEGTFAQLQIPQGAEVTLGQTAVNPTNQLHDTRIDPSLTQHLSLSRQEIQQQERARQRTSNNTSLNEYRFIGAIVVLGIFVLISCNLMTSYQTTTSNAHMTAINATIEQMVAEISETPTVETTAPINPTRRKQFPIISQYQLGSVYDTILYSPATDTLIGRPLGTTFLYLHDMTLSRSNDNESTTAVVDYLVLTDMSAIGEMRIASTDTTTILIPHLEGASILNIKTEQQTNFDTITEACEFVGLTGTCLETPPILDNQVCPTIWQGDGNYYLTRCGEIYWQPEDSSPILARTIPLDSGISDLIETQSGQLIILGDSRFALYDAQTMQGDVYPLTPEGTRTQHLFLSESEDYFYIVHLPGLLTPTPITTHWVLVGQLQ